MIKGIKRKKCFDIEAMNYQKEALELVSKWDYFMEVVNGEL